MTGLNPSALLLIEHNRKETAASSFPPVALLSAGINELNTQPWKHIHTYTSYLFRKRADSDSWKLTLPLYLTLLPRNH